MEKLARKPSADPSQERLRQNKANWNKEVSSFVNDLIHLKKMMNGWPSKWFKERSRITQPIPADPATIIGSMAGDFQEIVNRGNAIVQEQVNYAKTRRQRQPKQMNLPLGEPQQKPAVPPEPEAPKPDLSKQLSLGLTASDAASDYYLISEASNPLTRFFHRMLSPGIGLSTEAARVRKYRMSLLDSALNTYKDLKKMQAEIVKSGPQSIFMASKLLDKVEDSYVFLASGLQAYKEAMPQGTPDTGGKIPPPAGKGEAKSEERPGVQSLPDQGQPPAMTDSQADAVAADVQTNANSFTGVAGMPALRGLANKYLRAPTMEDKNRVSAGLLAAHRQVVTQICANKGIPVQDTLADIIAMSTKNAMSDEDQMLQALGQNILGKWRHQLSPFDKTSALRLDIYKVANESRKHADKIMDHLEDSLTIEVMAPMVKELGNNILKMRTMMQGLTATIKGQGYQPQFINQLEKERNVDLDPKQKEQLSKLLQQKQMREITKMYGR